MAGSFGVAGLRWVFKMKEEMRNAGFLKYGVGSDDFVF